MRDSLILIVLIVLLAGCSPLVAIDKPTVPVLDAPENREQHSGPQTSGDRGVNVGTVRIDGGALALGITGVVVLVGLLARSRAGYRRAAATLVRHNADVGIDENTKRRIQLAAYRDGSEPWLHQVVKRNGRQAPDGDPTG